jgi:hypothetical protein
MVLMYQSSEFTFTLKAGRKALLGSDTLLKFAHPSLHSTLSQKLLEASSDYDSKIPSLGSCAKMTNRAGRWEQSPKWYSTASRVFSNSR